MDSRTSRTIDGRTQSGFRDEAEAKAECDSYAETGERAGAISISAYSRFPLRVCQLPRNPFLDSFRLTTQKLCRLVS
jgi:hypothetical protein